jgi:hypothetical protein
MFSFMKKNAATEMTSLDEQLPDGCEALSECEFAEISGGALVRGAGTLGLVAHL